MSRRFTLEDYLEEFVDEHTESAEDEMKLLVTDAQVRSVGLFFIDGMVGLIKCLRSERGTPLSLETLDEEHSDQVTDDVNTDVDELIN
jgi:hypothetical protein